MDMFQAIIIGAIEGFTEFLPISSTGHMIVASRFLGVDQDSLTKAYEVVIQSAAILAVLIHYKSKISFKKVRLWWHLMVAFLPLAIVGFLAKDLIKSFFDMRTVAWMFIVGGVVFLIVESLYGKRLKISSKEDVEQITLKESFWIGVAQLFALIPGTSRAGSSIIGAMLLGLNRKIASEFSFLLAIPVIGAVTAYDLLKHYREFAEVDLMAYGVGFLVAFVVAYGTIRLLLDFLSRFSFVAFGIYRILFGVLLLMWL